MNKTWIEEFDKKCILTIDGKCKYWKPESFGYKEGDNTAPLDKFFPEQIKQFISELLQKQEADIRAKVIEEIIAEIPKAKDVNYQAMGNFAEDEGYNMCLKQVLSILDNIK